jgi:hypothetical protein
MARDELPDFMKYQYGASAARLLGSKESAMYAPSALEVLAGDKGLKLGDDAVGFIRGTQASEKGTQTAAGIYAEKFYEARGTYKPSQLVSWYDSVLNGLDKKVNMMKQLDLYIQNIQKQSILLMMMPQMVYSQMSK